MDKFIERAEAEAKKLYFSKFVPIFVEGAQFGRKITPEELEAAAKAVRLAILPNIFDYQDVARAAFRAIHCTFTDEAQP